MFEQPKRTPITDEMVIDAMRKLPPNADPEKRATEETTDPDAIQVVLSEDETKGDAADLLLAGKISPEEAEEKIRKDMREAA